MERTSAGLVLALWAAGLGAAAQFGKMSVTFGELSALYGAGGPLAGWIVSLVGLVGILFGVAAGLAVAWIGYRRALVGALALGAAVSLFQATLPPAGWMLASRALEGVSHLAIVVAAPTLIAQLSAPRHRALTLSLWSTFFGVAFALLAWVALPFAGGGQALFAGHGLYMTAMAAVIAAALPSGAAGPRGAPLRLGAVLRDHLTIYRSPELSAPALGWVCYAGAFLAILTVMPAHLPPGARAFTIGAMPLAGIACSMTLGVALLRRFPAVAVAQAGFLASLAASVPLWLLPGQVWPYLLLSAAMGLIQGSSFAAVPQLNAGAQAQSQANGALAQMGNLGTTCGTPLLAALVAWAGPHGFLLFAAALFLGGFAVHRWTARRRRFTEA